MKRGAPMGNCNAAKNKSACRSKAGAGIKKQHDVLRKYTAKMEKAVTKPRKGSKEWNRQLEMFRTHPKFGITPNKKRYFKALYNL